MGEWGGGRRQNKRGRWLLARLQQPQQLVAIVCARRQSASGPGAARFVPSRAPAPVPRNRGGRQEVNWGLFGSVARVAHIIFEKRISYA